MCDKAAFRGESRSRVKPDCDICRHRQKPLDPDGCFIGAGSTDWFGRIWVRLFGCDSFEQLSSWRVDAGRDKP